MLQDVGGPAVCRIRQKCSVIQSCQMLWYNVSKIRPCAGQSLASRRGHMTIYAPVALLRKVRLGHRTSVISTRLTGGLRLPTIPSSLLPSNIIINPSFVSFYIHSAYFISNSPLSPSPPTRHRLCYTSPLSVRWNLQLAICQSLPCPTMTRMHIHTCTHRHMLRHSDRKSCRGV